MHPQSCTLIELLRTRAAGDAAGRGYVFLGDGERECARLTFAELDARARALSAILRTRIEAPANVILAYPPGLEFIVGFFAAMYAGLVAVPACLPHPRKGGERFAAVAADCAAKHVLTTAAGVRLLAAAAANTASLAALEILATDAPRAPAEDVAKPRASAADPLAFLQYTSGSTRSPRGVQISQANVLANLAAIHAAEGNDEDTRGVCWLPAYHDMGLIEGILQPLYGGFCTWLMPHAAFLQRPARWLQAITRYGATVSGGPNFAFEACVGRIPEADAAALDLRTWQVAYCGAEPVRAQTLEAFAARFARAGFRRSALRPVYGLAEATLLVSASDASADGPKVVHADKRTLDRGCIVPASATAPARALVSCGAPARGVNVAVLEPGKRQPARPRHIGEIWVSGPAVSAGYHAHSGVSPGRDESLQTIFAGVHARWVCTGDLGVMLDGELYITGRSKDVIIVRGRKLHPQDIEHTVSRLSAPQVTGAAAFALDDTAAEGVVVLAELREAARMASAPGEHYQSYADAIRAEVYREHEVALAALAFLPPGALARTSSGKLMRFRCKQDFVNAQLPLIARFDAPRHTGRT